MAMSLAEMASICPISGAQYHWTALFAPPRIRHFMTWMQGKSLDLLCCLRDSYMSYRLDNGLRMASRRGINNLHGCTSIASAHHVQR